MIFFDPRANCIPLEELSENYHFGVVAVPPDSQYEVLRSISPYANGLIVEKPFGLNVQESKEMWSLSRRHNLSLVVNYQLRYFPEFFQFIQEGLRQSQSMSIIYHSSSYLRSESPNWYFEAAKGGGAAFAIFSHFAFVLSLLRPSACRVDNRISDTNDLTRIVGVVETEGVSVLVDIDLAKTESRFEVESLNGESRRIDLLASCEGLSSGGDSPWANGFQRLLSERIVFTDQRYRVIGTTEREAESIFEVHDLVSKLI